MNLKILIIEDTADVADRLKTAIEEKMKAIGHVAEVDLCDDFDEAPKKLRRFRPHAVTLDLKRDPLDDHAAKPAWEVVRGEHFCPVLFYSAVPLPPDIQEGEFPFAKYLRKAADNNGDEVAAAELLGAFVPHIEGLQKLWNDVESRYALSVARVSKLIWDSETEENRGQALIRVTRRRLASMLEHPLGEETNIKAWEQFVYPPTDENHLCTGDVVFRCGGIKTNAADFRVILSPPCDLVVGANRHPVSEVLLGRCVPVRHPDVLRKTSKKALKENGQPNTELPAQLGRSLCGDKCDGMIVIPKLAGVFPAMVLDLKSLETVERVKIALAQEAIDDGVIYARLASMDSPFREALSWRFTHSIGRPGYPVMDEASLAKDVEEEALKD